MARGDFETLSKHGQRVNRVEGEEELSQGYASKDEAIQEGRRLANEHGTRHTLRDAEPIGVVTDEQDDDDEVIGSKDVP